MKVIQNKFGVLTIQPEVHWEKRGPFVETYRKDWFPYEFVQDNQSISTYGTLRGLHAQIKKPQGKLIRVVSGTIFDVAVDVRKFSKTFGKQVINVVNAEEFKMVFIPPGFLHGFCVLSNKAVFSYKCSEYYDPDDEVGVLWSDESLNIDWPFSEPNVSERDGFLPPFSEIKKIFQD